MHSWGRGVSRGKNPFTDWQKIAGRAVEALAELWYAIPTGSGQLLSGPARVRLWWSVADAAVFGEHGDATALAGFLTAGYREALGARSISTPGHDVVQVELIADPAIPRGKFVVEPCLDERQAAFAASQAHATVVDPSIWAAEPGTQPAVDPNAATVVDPHAQLPVDPNAATVVDPSAQLAVDLSAQLAVDASPATAADSNAQLAVNPHAAAAAPITAAPAAPNGAVPVAPDAPVVPITAGPVAPNGAAPVAPDAPVVPITAAPAAPNAAAPVAPDAPITAAPATPNAPVAPSPSVPVAAPVGGGAPGPTLRAFPPPVGPQPTEPIEPQPIEPIEPIAATVQETIFAPLELGISAPGSADRQPFTYIASAPAVEFGRSPRCHITFDAPTVSQLHGRFCWMAGDRSWGVQDLGSRNGVLLNGTAIDDLAPVHDGDVIALGRSAESPQIAVRLPNSRAQ
ncbi:MAG: FHA domain-containing protein [Frankiaceae bacterium]|jgi:hypothetical protein|nr:FHA domain-containing protein [Frankiaceae bacterium]